MVVAEVEVVGAPGDGGGLSKVSHDQFELKDFFHVIGRYLMFRSIDPSHGSSILGDLASSGPWEAVFHTNWVKYICSFRG